MKKIGSAPKVLSLPQKSARNLAFEARPANREALVPTGEPAHTCIHRPGG